MTRLTKGSEEAHAHMLKMRTARKGGPRTKKTPVVEETPSIVIEDLKPEVLPEKLTKKKNTVKICSCCGK